MLCPVWVILTPARVAIKQSTRDRRVIDRIIILVLKLVQAAFPASIAHRFPFLLGHLGKFFNFPKRFFGACGSIFIGHFLSRLGHLLTWRRPSILDVVRASSRKPCLSHQRPVPLEKRHTEPQNGNGTTKLGVFWPGRNHVEKRTKDSPAHQPRRTKVITHGIFHMAKWRAVF